jgi:hypothetical protein
MSGIRESLRDNIGQSIKGLRDRGRRLVELNIELLQAEMKVLAARYGAAVALIVMAALLAFFGLGFLLATGAVALDLVLPLWASVLIVAVLLFLLAAILILIARSLIRAAQNPAPEKAIAEAKATADAVKAGVRTVGRRGKTAAKDAASSTAAAASSRVRSAGARMPRPGDKGSAEGPEEQPPEAGPAEHLSEAGPVENEVTAEIPALKHVPPAGEPLKHVPPPDEPSSPDEPPQSPPESRGGERAPE